MRKQFQISNFKYQISNTHLQAIFSLFNYWKLEIGNWKFSRGFTLIELLIVIVIIGILSTFIVSNFIGVRERARDAQRKTDLRQIQTALQLYYTDNGYYPQDFESCGEEFTSGTVTYMKKIPCDPSSKEPYFYTALDCSGVGECTEYELETCVENEKDPDAEPADPSVCTAQGAMSVKVTNP